MTLKPDFSDLTVEQVRAHGLSVAQHTRAMSPPVGSILDNVRLVRDAQIRDRIEFASSPLCERMISDIMRVQAGLDSEFSYVLKQTQARFGWYDLPKEVIQLFIDTMTDGEVTAIEHHLERELEEGEEDDGSEWSCIKRGLHINSLSGQGTVYFIRPATVEELALVMEK
jgi:hypothetical protein